jgi:3-phosphoshikimate 1-carboxyvinyltransferase
MIPLDLKTTHIMAEGSKSLINRILMLVSFTKEPFTIRHFSSCSDVITMTDIFRKLEFEIDTANSNEIVIIPPNEIPSRFNLYVQDSATGLRFLIARLASIPYRSFRLSFSEQLQKRPLMPLLQVLYRMGAKFVLHQDSISIEGMQLKGGLHEITGSISSQFISALLLLAPTFKEDLELIISDDIVSENYFTMTIAVMQKFGLTVERLNNSLFISANQTLNNRRTYLVEPDYSSLAYFWALGALSINPLSTEYYPQSLQSDYHFIDVLQKMGAVITYEPNKALVKFGNLTGIEQSMLTMPDQVPTLAVLALFANSPTKIHNIAHLRHKESNRLQALADELRKLGARILVSDDSLEIYPLQNPPQALCLKTYQDHRLIMAFSILKFVFSQIELDNISAVNKSNPLFFNELNKIIKSNKTQN